MGDITLPTWGLKDAYLKEVQSKDALCQRIFGQATKNGEKAIHLDTTSTSKASCKKGRGVETGEEGDGEEGGIGGAQGTKYKQ